MSKSHALLRLLLHLYSRLFLNPEKRTGPDLARVGGKYSDEWHKAHLVEPRDLVPESIMPSYEFLLHKPLKTFNLRDHLAALVKVGVPYTEEMIDNAEKDAHKQGLGEMRTDISGLQERYGEDVNARDFDGQPNKLSEMDALIAYLQVLGSMVDFEEAKKVEGNE